VSELNAIIQTDGQKNVTVHVTGILTKDIVLADILAFSNLSGRPAKLRLESVTFAIQEKAGLYLWWRGRDSNKTLILPLESRGWFDFEKIGCIQSPAETIGMSISSFGVNAPKAFLLILDMGKQ
jgi:hypothetical protein